MRVLLIALALVGCKKDKDTGDTDAVADPPLGMILENDGQIYAGAAMVDITPVVVETYSDLNDNNEFNGCLDDPTAAGDDCDEPFDDVNGNGIFDPVWIGGFGPLRAAHSVHDPIEARAVVLSYDGEYVALVGLDLVGLTDVRIHPARDRLVAEGFAVDNLIVASTHNHHGPDTMGLWGDPLSGVTGLDLDYQVRVEEAIEQVVRAAAADMKAVDLTIGAVQMRDQSQWFNGSVFGGKNPTAKMHGMIHDIRDPVVVSDQLLVVQGVADSGTVFTYTNWSGHPETWGGESEVSSDWVGVTRGILESTYGGVVVHQPESLGGMQSALGGDVPLVDEAGVHIFADCDVAAIADPSDVECFGLNEGDPRIDGDGDAVPEWAPHDSWEFVNSHGWHIAEAAIVALDGSSSYTDLPIRVDSEQMYLPLTNVSYEILGPMGIFDLKIEDAVVDNERCPEKLAGLTNLGCIPARTLRLQLGPIGFTTAPGELVPELARGFPDDAVWSSESGDVTARGPGSTYFPQHDPDCNTLGFEECSQTDSDIGECDCLKYHVVPYVISPNPGDAPLLDAWDTEYTAIIGMADTYLSYILPEPDFNHQVSLFSDDGDHYEDTVSPSEFFGSKLLEAQGKIDERW